MSQKTNIAALIVSIFCLLCVFLYSILIVFESSPIYFTNIPFPVEGDNITVGGGFTFSVDRCNDYSRPVSYQFSQILRNIETSKDYTFPGGIAAAPPGCRTIESIPKAIPENIEPGRYILRFDLVVPGRFRQHAYSIQTESFEITEGDN